MKYFKVYICENFTSHSGYDDFINERDSVYSFKKQDPRARFIELAERVAYLRSIENPNYNQRTELADKLPLYNKLKKRFGKWMG